MIEPVRSGPHFLLAGLVAGKTFVAVLWNISGSSSMHIRLRISGLPCGLQASERKDGFRSGA